MKMKRLFFLLIFTLTFLFAAMGWATDWYCAATGTNGDGSESNPWVGFSNVVQGAGGVQDGDTLWLDGTATFNNQTLTLTVGCTVDGSWKGGKATIDGQSTAHNAIVVDTDSMPIIRNIIIKNTTNNSIGATVSGYAFNLYNSDIYSAGNNAISASGSGGNIIGVNIYSPTNSGIYLHDASNWKILNCTISGGGVASDGITPHDGTGSNIEIGNCIISGFSENAIDIQSGFSSVDIHDIIAFDTSEPLILVHGDASIQRCTLYDSNNCAIYVSGSCAASYNLIYDTGKGSSAEGIYITSTATSVSFDNNTVVATADSERHAISVESGGGVDSIRNNILVLNENMNNPSWRYCIYFADSTDLSGASIDYNCYYAPGDTGVFKVGSDNYATLSSWQNDTTHNNGNYDQNSIEQDPLLTPTYHLSRNSPCIDAGTKLSIHDASWQDLDGNRVRYGTAPDIGCYEHHSWALGRWGCMPWAGADYKVQWAPYTP